MVWKCVFPLRSSCLFGSFLALNSISEEFYLIPRAQNYTVAPLMCITLQFGSRKCLQMKTSQAIEATASHPSGPPIIHKELEELLGLPSIMHANTGVEKKKKKKKWSQKQYISGAWLDPLNSLTNKQMKQGGDKSLASEGGLHFFFVKWILTRSKLDGRSKHNQLQPSALGK